MPGGLTIEDYAQLLGPRDGLRVGKIAMRHGEPSFTKRVFTISRFVGVEQ